MRINADLFRIASATISTEDTRFYLGGVLVEPMAVGALLVSTDDHRMTVIRDWSATFAANEPAAIIRLAPDVLKACKAKNNESRRMIEVDVTGNRATVVSEDDYTRETGGTRRTELAAGVNVVIDGTFPDWRRVLPKPGPAVAHDAFASHYVAAFSDIGQELARAAHIAATAKATTRVAKPNLTPAMQILSSQKEAPAMVRWFGIEDAFGVLMPVRSFTDSAVALPAWVPREQAWRAA